MENTLFEIFVWILGIWIPCIIAMTIYEFFFSNDRTDGQPLLVGEYIVAAIFAPIFMVLLIPHLFSRLRASDFWNRPLIKGTPAENKKHQLNDKEPTSQHDCGSED